MDWPTDAGFTLAPGMRVCSRGLGVAGEIVNAGKFPGEWLVRQPDGQVVVCLAENLRPWLWEEARVDKTRGGATMDPAAQKPPR